MPESLITLLRESVARRPAAEAVIYRDARVSYEALWRDACAVARFLEAGGLGKGERVAILIENSPQYIAAYYAALMAGGVAVAMNAAAKAHDLRRWVSHSGARWLIADVRHPELAALLSQAPTDLRVLAIGGSVNDARMVATWEETIRAGAGAADPAVRNDPADIAAIIYTSGTTSEPKGVTLSHGNLVANVCSILDYLHLNENDRCLNLLPFHYSYGNSVLHTHLAVGGALVIENSLVYLQNVLAKIGKEGVTGLPGVPSTFALILNRVQLGDHDLSALRYVTVAGGALAPAHLAKLQSALPRVRIFVMYGQTEATARLSYLPPERLAEKTGSAGMAIPGAELQIRNEQGNPVTHGTVGEIWARGPNIMQGYWNDPQTTASVLADGWLKTGDLAYMDDEGYVFIQGRSSDMIKSGAHRISPQDIEEVVAELDGVGEVAVAGVADEILGQVIKAVIVPRPQAEISEARVKAHCLTRLPSFKIPKYVEFRTELPRTSSGKVKRYLLAGQAQ